MKIFEVKSHGTTLDWVTRAKLSDLIAHRKACGNNGDIWMLDTDSGHKERIRKDGEPWTG